MCVGPASGSAPLASALSPHPQTLTLATTHDELKASPGQPASTVRQQHTEKAQTARNNLPSHRYPPPRPRPLPTASFILLRPCSPWVPVQLGPLTPTSCLRQFSSQLVTHPHPTPLIGIHSLRYDHHTHRRLSSETLLGSRLGLGPRLYRPQPRDTVHCPRLRLRQQRLPHRTPHRRSHTSHVLLSRAP